MSSINSISHISSFMMTSGGSTLSRETIEKLLALGIDPTTVTSESQARTLIEQAEAAKNKDEKHNPQQGGKGQEERQSDIKVQQNIYDAMNMISLSNKLILGL